MKRILFILALALFIVTDGVNAQMTRGQLLRRYYQITQLHSSGKDAEAIAICEEITSMYPKLPDTYLRMAQIYDDGSENELALVMYRTYASLEMDDKKVAEIAPRMNRNMVPKVLSSRKRSSSRNLLPRQRHRPQTSRNRSLKHHRPLLPAPHHCLICRP